MFGKEQPDVVTEEEVGDYIEQLKSDGLVEIDYAELEQRVMALPEKDRNLRQCENYMRVYGTSPIKSLEGDMDELARLSEDYTSGTQGKK